MWAFPYSLVGLLLLLVALLLGATIRVCYGTLEVAGGRLGAREYEWDFPGNLLELNMANFRGDCYVYEGCRPSFGSVGKRSDYARRSADKRGQPRRWGFPISQG